MYHPSKRRKVERTVDQPTGEYGLHHGRERARSLGESRKERPAMPKIVLQPHEDQGSDALRSARQVVERLRQPSTAKEESTRTLHSRQIVPAPLNHVVPAKARPVTTMVAVDVSNGNDIVSQVIEPMNPNTNTVNVPGIGEVNITDTSNPSPPATTSDNSNFVPGSVVPPAAVQASIARSQALATQEAIANVLDSVPQSLAVSATPENRAAASQSPTGASGLGSSSQQVLSAPSTPLPPTPQSSIGSSSSFFSPTSSPSPTPNPSIPSSAPSPAATNSTTSATTSMGSSAAAYSSLASVSSQSSSIAAILFAQSKASQASVSSITSAASISSGFTTSTLIPQSTNSITSAASTTLPASISSQLASQSSAASTVTASTVSSATGLGAGGVAGSGTTGTAVSPTLSSGSSSNNTAPSTPMLVGGIVGGVAGLAMVLFFLLLLFRWRRSKTGQRRIISPPILQEATPGAGRQSGTMTQRSSTAPIVGAILSRMRPTSSQTAQTAATTDTAPSERGFQKISGRKLPSVLASGGDGYGDNTAAGPSAGPSGPGIQRNPGVVPGQGPLAGLAPSLRPSNPSQPSPSGSLSGSSFYHDSQGFYGGVVPDPEKTETSSSPLASSPTTIAPLAAISGSLPEGGSPTSRRDEIANMRPGPARTPVINQPGQFPVRAPSRPQHPSRPMRATPPPVTDLPRPRDGLGRSHPSQDGSRGSRFREDTTPP